MNVYLGGVPFDAKEYWTEGESDDFDYDETVSIPEVRHEQFLDVGPTSQVKHHLV